MTLKYPEWEKPFYIEADASALGVAAVLSQINEKTRLLRLICYHSTALGLAQRNYSAGIHRTEMVSVSKAGFSTSGSREIFQWGNVVLLQNFSDYIH